jgi:carbon-monoxide dehydrogenase small subunit
MTAIAFELNREAVSIEADPAESLLEVLRSRGLVGAKRGCNYGVCGACTVLLHGKPVRSCLLRAGMVEQSSVLTIEGLAEFGKLSAIQQSFLDCGSVQCGFCIPGMILTAYALLAQKGKPELEEIREAISGNLCRCSGYVKIIEAIQKAGD